MTRRPKTRHAARSALPGRTALSRAAGFAGAVLALALLLIWLAVPRHTTEAGAAIGGPFSLVSDTGHTVTDRSFTGKYLIVYFGYTRCRDVCPATLNTLSAALDRLGGKAARIQPLFITLDPAYDTPATLHRFVTAISPRLIGLGGSQAALRQAADAYHATAILNGTAGGAYQLDHSSVLYLMAPDGHFVAPIPADASEPVLTQALSRYLS
jgi:protein SCO1/2